MDCARFFFWHPWSSTSMSLRLYDALLSVSLISKEENARPFMMASFVVSLFPMRAILPMWLCFPSRNYLAVLPRQSTPLVYITLGMTTGIHSSQTAIVQLRLNCTTLFRLPITLAISPPDLFVCLRSRMCAPNSYSYVCGWVQIRYYISLWFMNRG